MGIRLRGEVADHAALLALPGPHEEGDSYVLRDTGNLWVWNGTHWVDAGHIVGPPGQDANLAGILAGNGISIVDNGNQTITIALGTWMANVNANCRSILNLAGITGCNGTLNITGDVNVIGGGNYLINGNAIDLGVVVSNVAPLNPKQGKLWFDSVSTQLFIWYDDGASSQWVVVINQNGLLRDAPEDGKHYVRKDGGWVEMPAGGGGGGGRAVTVSENAPANPEQGDLWFDAKSTQLFLRYVDPTSEQWVVAINESGLLRDAPDDGNAYVRKGGAWVDITTL